MRIKRGITERRKERRGSGKLEENEWRTKQKRMKGERNEKGEEKDEKRERSCGEEKGKKDKE